MVHYHYTTIQNQFPANTKPYTVIQYTQQNYSMLYFVTALVTVFCEFLLALKRITLNSKTNDT